MIRKALTSLCMAALSAGALLSTPASAQVPDTYARQLASQLVVVEQAAAQDGYRRALGPISGSADQGGFGDHVITLQANVTYQIVGVCDNDCRDVDIRLYDEDNILIDEDLLNDDLPIVEVTPIWTGPFRVRVIMANCRVEPCYYAFNVYGR
jgi:hypothetical protein